VLRQQSRGFVRPCTGQQQQSGSCLVVDGNGLRSPTKSIFIHHATDRAVAPAVAAAAAAVLLLPEYLTRSG